LAIRSEGDRALPLIIPNSIKVDPSVCYHFQSLEVPQSDTLVQRRVLRLRRVVEMSEGIPLHKVLHDLNLVLLDGQVERTSPVLRGKVDVSPCPIQHVQDFKVSSVGSDTHSRYTIILCVV
jgi:hypothetical protein